MGIKKISKTSFIIILLHILEPIVFSADANPTASFNKKDGRSRKIIHDKSGKKIFTFYNNNGQVTSIITTQKDGTKTLRTKDPEFPDKKVLHTYFPDGFKQSYHFHDDRITETLPYQDSVHADRTTFHIAYHEAAHTLAQALKYNLARPLKVLIAPKKSLYIQDINIKVGGYLQSEQTYLEQLTKQQLTNALIVCLSGAIGEQIFYNTKMLQDEQEMQLLYRQPSMRSDMSNAEQIGLLLFQSNYHKEFHRLLAETYKETYLFQSKYKKYLRKLAHALVKKESLTQDEIYNIVDIATKPLKFGEIGPLEKQFEDDYKLREIVMNKIKKQKEKIPQTFVLHNGQVTKSPFAQDNILQHPAFKPNFRYRY